jgi:hypothetical protein
MITPRIELLQIAEGGFGERSSDELREDAGTRMEIVLAETSREGADHNIEPVVNPSDPTPPETSLDPCSGNFLTSVALTEPPVSSTKGRKSFSEAKSAKKGPTNPYNTYNGGQGKRECQTCHVRGHYSTTCPQNPNRLRAAERKAKKRGGKIEGWSPRKRGRPRIKKGEAGGKEEGHSERDEPQLSDFTMAAGETSAHRVIARIRRATTYHVDYSDNTDLGDYESN